LHGHGSPRCTALREDDGVRGSALVAELISEPGGSELVISEIVTSEIMYESFLTSSLTSFAGFTSEAPPCPCLLRGPETVSRFRDCE
jgi:hypothetical protein